MTMTRQGVREGVCRMSKVSYERMRKKMIQIAYMSARCARRYASCSLFHSFDAHVEVEMGKSA